LPTFQVVLEVEPRTDQEYFSLRMTEPVSIYIFWEVSEIASEDPKVPKRNKSVANIKISI